MGKHPVLGTVLLWVTVQPPTTDDDDGRGTCWGEGVSKRGAFTINRPGSSVGSGSTWDVDGGDESNGWTEAVHLIFTTSAAAHGGGGGGGGSSAGEMSLKWDPATKRLLLLSAPSFSSSAAATSSSAGEGGIAQAPFALSRVGRGVAVRAKEQLEARRLARELWRTVVEVDLGAGGGAGGGLVGGYPLHGLATDGHGGGGGGLWAELLPLAGLSNGDGQLEQGFHRTLLWMVCREHARSLRTCEFSAPLLRLRWNNPSTAQAPPSPCSSFLNSSGGGSGIGCGGLFDPDALYVESLGMPTVVQVLGQEAAAGAGGASGGVDPFMHLFKTCVDSAAEHGASAGRDDEG